VADPANYPAIYPLIERVKVTTRSEAAIEYEMSISMGAGSTTQRLRLERRPGQVLQSSQASGRSTWQFFDAGASACVLHFTHDEDLTRDSVVMRMALSGKQPIIQGIQAATAVGNVRNVRAYLDRSKVHGALSERVVGATLARLAREGTTAYLPHQKGLWPMVAARAGASKAKALAEAGASERWESYVPGLAGEQVSIRADGQRRMRYTLEAVFEDLDFETWQRREADRVDEKIIGGELTKGGWGWRAVTDARGAVLLLNMRLRIAEGDWVVEKLTAVDPIAEEGTLLGIAFMLVEKVAARAARAP